jgi:hypothetical protein
MLGPNNMRTGYRHKQKQNIQHDDEREPRHDKA